LSAGLNEDSCFWAHVEDAIILCDLLKNEGSVTDAEKATHKEELIKFEDYVWGVIDNFAVSPDIFLEKSSFMQWWKKYKGIVGSAYSSPLADFMNRRAYHQYI
jgi:hypothetical protein